MFGGEIQEPFGGHVIEPREVGAQFADAGKVAGGLFRGSEGAGFGVGRERAVGDAFGEEFVLAQTEEFAVHSDAGVGHSAGHFGSSSEIWRARARMALLRLSNSL